MTKEELKKHHSLVCRMAGNIAGGVVAANPEMHNDAVASEAVDIAMQIFDQAKAVGELEDD